MKTLYCIPNLKQLAAFTAFSEQYHAGFEYNDFFLPSVLDDADAVEKRIAAYTAIDRDRSEDTLHGTFFDVCVNSDDPLIFRASDYRVHQSLEIGLRLGVRAVIFHTNHIPNFRLQSYRENWLMRNTAYWKKILNEYPTLCIYLENMFDEEPELLQQLATAMQEEPRFGVCLDFPHAYISHTPLADWCDALKPYVRHLHLNDNHKVEDLHHPLGQGTLPWHVYGEFIASIPEHKRPSVLLEVRGYEDLMTSVAYLEQHGLYPFQK